MVVQVPSGLFHVDGVSYTILIAPLLLSLVKNPRYQFIWCIWYLYTAATLYTFFYINNTPLKIFIGLFLFRYVRLIVNLIAFCRYQPIAVPRNPSLTAKDVTVIVPTVEPFGKYFEECIRSIYANGPARIIIVTAGPGNYDTAVKTLSTYSNMVIKHCVVQNKRRQVCDGLTEVATPITVLCDDHVFWPRHLLPNILAPFEDPTVGSVGTNKRVRHTTTAVSSAGFWNLLGCLYLERHNFETAATSSIDGGVFVVSGRTSAHRSAILQTDAFRHGFVHERVLFDLVGPLNADDDNFITRWMVTRGWGLRIQHSDAARVETTLGEYPAFLAQCLRWARTTWRSNPRSLLLFVAQRQRQQPWCLYAVHLSSLVNFALAYDAALLCTLSKTTTSTSKIPLLALGVWILATKLVKPWPHFRRHPRDLVYLPAYILFGYVHSVIKFYALLTFWNTAWGSRALGGEEEGGVGIVPLTGSDEDTVVNRGGRGEDGGGKGEHDDDDDGGEKGVEG